MNVYFKNDLKNVYLILESDEGVSEDYQTYMIKENEISGLVKTDVRYVNGRSQYYYDISGMTSLRTVHEKVKLTRAAMSKIVHALLRTIKEIQKFMLEGDCILLDPDYIYCVDETYFFCYFPGKKIRLEEEFHRLTEYFVSETDYQDRQAVHFAYNIHKATMEENYSIEQILKRLETEEKPMEQVNQERERVRVNYEERMEHSMPSLVEEKRDFWEPVKRLIERKKKGKWGYWDDIHIEEDDL